MCVQEEKAGLYQGADIQLKTGCVRLFLPTLSDVKMDTDSSKAPLKKKKQAEEENMDSSSTNTVQ